MPTSRISVILLAVLVSVSCAWTLQEGAWPKDEQDNGVSEEIYFESEPSDSGCEAPAASGSILSPPSNVEGPKTCKPPDQKPPRNVGSPEDLLSRLITMESDLDEFKWFCDFLQKVIVKNGQTPLEDGSSNDERQERILILLSRAQNAEFMIKNLRNLVNYYLYPPPLALQEYEHLVTGEDLRNLAGKMVEIIDVINKLREDTVEVLEAPIVQ